jgi:hypothetical protein
MIYAGIILAAASWIIASVIGVLAFHNTSIQVQLFAPNPHEIITRWAFVSVIMGFSVYSQILFDRRCQAEDSLKQRLDMEKKIAVANKMLVGGGNVNLEEFLTL